MSVNGTQPSASTLVDGIEVLATLFHPKMFELPDRLKEKVDTQVNVEV